MLFSAIGGSNQTWLGLASLVSEGSVLQLDTCLHLIRMLVFPAMREWVCRRFGAISGAEPVQAKQGLDWLGVASVMSEGNVVQPYTCLHLTCVLVLPKNARMGVLSSWCH